MLVVGVEPAVGAPAPAARQVRVVGVDPRVHARHHDTVTHVTHRPELGGANGLEIPLGNRSRPSRLPGCLEAGVEPHAPDFRKPCQLPHYLRRCADGDCVDRPERYRPGHSPALQQLFDGKLGCVPLCLEGPYQLPSGAPPPSPSKALGVDGVRQRHDDGDLLAGLEGLKHLFQLSTYLTRLGWWAQGERQQGADETQGDSASASPCSHPLLHHQILGAELPDHHRDLIARLDGRLSLVGEEHEVGLPGNGLVGAA